MGPRQEELIVVKNYPGNVKINNTLGQIQWYDRKNRKGTHEKPDICVITSLRINS